MAVYAYSRVPAFNPNTSPVSVAKSATGSLYDIGDTGFLTPLNLTLVATNTVTTTLVSDANGMFPDFTLLNRTQCVFKSGANVFVLTTTTPIPGPPSTVPGPPGTPGVADDASVAALLSNPASLTRAAGNATYVPAFAPSPSIVYDSATGLVTSSTENGITTAYTYNADGTVNTETRLGKVRTWAYDANGNPTSSTVV